MMKICPGCGEERDAENDFRWRLNFLVAALCYNLGIAIIEASGFCLEAKGRWLY